MSFEKTLEETVSRIECAIYPATLGLCLWGLFYIIPQMRLQIMLTFFYHCFIFIFNVFFVYGGFLLFFFKFKFFYIFYFLILICFPLLLSGLNIIFWIDDFSPFLLILKVFFSTLTCANGAHKLTIAFTVFRMHMRVRLTVAVTNDWSDSIHYICKFFSREQQKCKKK